METIKIYEAKTNLSALIERAAGGESIIIAKGDRPMAMLVPLGNALQPREPVAALKGKWDQGAWKALDREIEDQFEEAIDKPDPT